jgi:plasmid stability protein
MKALTIRNVDAALAAALERERKRRGASLNQTVLELLRSALGSEPGEPRSNGLAKLAGTWSAKDLRDFERVTRAFEQVDDELWS